jgi:chromosome segregation ATPase
LGELLSKAEKMLATCEGYLRQAQKSIEQGRQSSEKLEISHGRAELISVELDKQFQVVRQLAGQLRLRINGMQRTLLSYKSRSNEVNEALQSIFERLRNQTLDEAFVNDQHDSLYDFVDSQSVQKLQRQAVQEIREMEKLHRNVNTIAQSMDSALKELKAAADAAEIRVDFRLSYPTEKTSLQLNEANAMSAISLSIASHCDQLRHLLQTRPGTKPKYADLSSVRKRAEQLPGSLSLAYSRLQRIQDSTKQIEERCQKYSTTFQRATQVFEQLEKFGLDVQEVVQQIDEHERAFEERRSEAAFLFEELANLTTWYELFGTAYEELLVEVERRHSEHKRIQEIVHAYQKELGLWYQGETQKRDNFFEFYGRYLPQSLCPAVMETVPRYEIYPLHFNTSLPVLGGRAPGDDAEHGAVAETSSLQ